MFASYPAAVRWAAALALAVAFLVPALMRPHEIPNDVTVQAFLKPEGQRLRLLLRVPLISMLDIEWPRREPDVLDVSRAEPQLRDASTLWVADNITIYE